MLSHFSCVWLCATPWTVARQAPLSMGFSRQEYWSRLLCPPSGDLPDPGSNPRLSVCCMGSQILYHWRDLGSPPVLYIVVSVRQSQTLCCLSSSEVRLASSPRVRVHAPLEPSSLAISQPGPCTRCCVRWEMCFWRSSLLLSLWLPLLRSFICSPLWLPSGSESEIWPIPSPPPKGVLLSSFFWEHRPIAPQQQCLLAKPPVRLSRFPGQKWFTSLSAGSTL